jgi:esterase/lipase
MAGRDLDLNEKGVIDLAAASMAGVHPAAQPYFFQGRDTGCFRNTGCLLIHGFTGSPPELLPLGKYLAERGCMVAAPLLAGHGTRVEDLAATSWQDWLQSAADALKRLREEPIERIFLIGISMGGLLSLMLAAEESAREARHLPRLAQQQQPLSQLQVQPQPKQQTQPQFQAQPQLQQGLTQQLQQPQQPMQQQSQPTQPRSSRIPVVGVVTINSPIFMQNRHARFCSLLRWFVTSTPKNHDPAYQAAADALRFSYSEMPLNGVANLMQLVKAVRRRLPQVKVPALIVQSEADETVIPVSAEYLYKYIGSPSKRLLWLKEAPHLVSLGTESEMVWQTIFEFIENNTENNIY